MEMETLIPQMKDCAMALYQNREQDAYEKINKILPEMNRILQELMSTSEEIEKIILSILSEFVEDFQIRDNLGLADLLGYTIPGIITAIIEGE